MATPPPVPEIVWDWEGTGPVDINLRLVTKIYASQFELAAGAQITQADFWVRRVGTWAANFFAELRQRDGATPGAVIETSSVIPVGDISTTWGWVSVTFEPTAVGALAAWFICLRTSASFSDRYIKGEKRTGPPNAGYVLQYSADGEAWTNASKSDRVTCRLWGLVG